MLIKVPLAISDFLVDKAGNRLFDISRHVAAYLTKLVGLLMPDDFLGSFPSEGRNSMFAPSIKDEDQLSIRLDLSENQTKPTHASNLSADLFLAKRPNGVKRFENRSPSPSRSGNLSKGN